jgi:hypothetical protein
VQSWHGLIADYDDVARCSSKFLALVVVVLVALGVWVVARWVDEDGEDHRALLTILFPSIPLSFPTNSLLIGK